MIDLEALARSAERDDGDCVVTRAWLRQVLAELTLARAGVPTGPAAELDVAPIVIEDLRTYLAARGLTVLGVDYGRPA
jgi:hypothetical protein